ncbi:MAG: alpha/beta hydrolase [Ponticaulis sp.]|nr:alpha/beta hydrolase [Ponticaulis sp.]|tara:strand:- start:13662 stop:14594 length:933 start_codon:yes stop_codon:yes gene_type:complete
MLSSEFVKVEGNPEPQGAAVRWLDGAEGRKLRMCVAPSLQKNPRGTVIVCPGRTEFIEKYFEVARELQDKGFAVLILDWPGQGLSSRLLPDSQKGHIDRFETFMNALRIALDEMQDELPRPHVSLAHSMGGAIALAAIAEGIIQVDAAAFSAPMWGIKSRFMGMKYLAWAMKTLGQGNNLVLKPTAPPTFEENIVTHDRARWEIHERLVAEDPALALGHVTWSWVGASLTVIDTFANPDKVAKVTCPVLIATAEEEELVDNESHERIAGHLKDAEHIFIKNSRHEILMETDEIRDQFWDAFDQLLKRAGV